MFTFLLLIAVNSAKKKLKQKREQDEDFQKRKHIFFAVILVCNFFVLYLNSSCAS